MVEMKGRAEFERARALARLAMPESYDPATDPGDPFAGPSAPITQARQRPWQGPPAAGSTGDAYNAPPPDLRSTLASLLGSAYGGDDPRAAEAFGNQGADVGNFLPLAGSIASGQQAKGDFQQGNYGSAGLNMLGALPEIGAPMKAMALGLMAKGGEKAGLGAAERLAAPAVHTGGNQSLIDKIFAHAEENRSPKYLPSTEPVFGPADPELTKQLVPQRSIAGELPPMPTGDTALPKNDRARGIFEGQDEIANRLVDDLSKAPAQPTFYSTGSVLQGLEDRAGLRPTEALDFMKDWSGQGAGTSPRTQTPQNLRNSSYLMFERAQGNPLTSERRAAEGNRPGFAMMGMHTDLADQFAKGTVDPWQNSKPYTFQQNWMGNMADPTVDTHNIRKVLDAYDRTNPGGLPKEWFTSPEAYDTYKQGGGFPQEGMLPVGDIDDRMGSAVVPGTGKKAQTEYSLFQNVNRLAAGKMGVTPAEVQERLWFEGGPRTGLRSPAVTIPGLLNSQIEATARATGLSPDAIMRLWAHRGIPLAQNEPDNEMPGASAVG